MKRERFYFAEEIAADAAAWRLDDTTPSETQTDTNAVTPKPASSPPSDD